MNQNIVTKPMVFKYVWLYSTQLRLRRAGCLGKHPVFTMREVERPFQLPNVV